jgi:hypothetical protein
VGGVAVGVDVLEAVLADPGARGLLAVHARLATAVHEDLVLH